MMKKDFLLLVILSVSILDLQSQEKTVTIQLQADQAKEVISKHVYGHFAEHLGACIYGGLWVGEQSAIPNQNGYRTDVLEALKQLSIPNLRWPGGCFADEYHWMDGVGPREQRPKMVNNWWGGVVEDNSFGTHEFLNLCEILGCEPYLSGNVGSGSVEEMAKWVEYITSEGDSPMANLRRKHGREKPWKVKFFGVGNESWGCGGNMTPQYYSDLYRRYATYCRDFDGNKLYKIASGASDYDYNWTETLMKNIGRRMHGLSLHYYTVKSWGENKKGSATDFSVDDYYWTIGKCLEIEEVVQKHIGIMDKYDAEKKIGLLVDEWGTWFNVEEGTNPGFLYQQNTMRDALVAALSLHVFNKYPERIQMANIAQIVNVLQSVILTNDDKMVLTPTYHVFDLYRVHQDAIHIPLSMVSDTKEIRGRDIPVVSASASKKGGAYHISLANIDLNSGREVQIDISGLNAKKVSGRLLSSASVNDHNTFEKPETVKPQTFKDAKIKGNTLNVKLPAQSVVVLEIN